MPDHNNEAQGAHARSASERSIIGSRESSYVQDVKDAGHSLSDIRLSLCCRNPMQAVRLPKAFLQSDPRQLSVSKC